MVFTIIEYGLSIADTFINIIFLEKLFGYKDKKKNVRYLFMVLYFLASQYLMVYLVPQLLCMVLIEAVYCMVALNGEKYEHIIWSILINVIYCAISSVVLPMLAIVTGKAATELAVAGSVERIWMVLIQKFLICMTLWTILSYKGKKLNLAYIEKLLVTTMLIANFFIVSGLYVISVSVSMETKTKNELFVISLLIVVVLLTCAVLVIKISSKNKQMMETHILKFQLENQVNMIENLRKNNEEVRVLRHDLKHYAVIIRDLLMDGNVSGALAGVEKYIEKTICAQQKTDYIKNNPSINAVIYNCVCKCNDKGITCHTKITTCYDESMEQDMAVVFANLLDNAIRAEEMQPDKKRRISISVFEEKRIVKCVINNYIEKSVLDDNPHLSTSKQDKELHGWGMSSVRNIIDKYIGDINIYEENNFFTVLIKMPKKLN